MTLRTGHATLLQQAWGLLALLGLALFATPGQAQIPNATYIYSGTSWYYYTGSPYSFPTTLWITSQETDKEGNWATLSGYLWTSSTFYYVDGTIYLSGWIDIYALNYDTPSFLHFYGSLRNHRMYGGGLIKVISGTWEQYNSGQGYVPEGAFTTYQDVY